MHRNRLQVGHAGHPGKHVEHPVRPGAAQGTLALDQHAALGQVEHLDALLAPDRRRLDPGDRGQRDHARPPAPGCGAWRGCCRTGEQVQQLARRHRGHQPSLCDLVRQPRQARLHRRIVAKRLAQAGLDTLPHPRQGLAGAAAHPSARCGLRSVRNSCAQAHKACTPWPDKALSCSTCGVPLRRVVLRHGPGCHAGRAAAATR